MHTSLVRFVSSLADSRAVYNPRTKRRLSGLLKIYKRRDVPRKPHCISFDRIAEHLRNEFIRLQAEHNVDLSFDELDLRRAIASFQPTCGTGSKAHVVIRSEARKQYDASQSAAQRIADQETQDGYFAEYLLADTPMPSFTLEIDGVLTTV